MKILLTTLNSKYVHMNLALRYLYESAIEYKDSISVKEFTINNEEDYIFTEIVSGGYDLICFSCYIWNIEKITYLAENIKKAQPNVKIILGGPEVSYETEALIEGNPWIDGIIKGEGEKTFRKLCSEFLKTGIIKIDNEVQMLEANEIPFPYNNNEIEKDKTLYYESTRGCPYSCSYCLSSIDKCIRAFPIDRTLKEIAFFLSQEVRQVKFIDRTFNWNEERCYTIIEFIINNDNGITNFHFEICAEIISERLIELLKKARKGQIQFEIGIQSTNEITISAVNRSGDFHKGKDKIERIIKGNNIHIHLDLIVGLPLEGYIEFKKSFNDTYSMRPQALQVGFLKMLKGTRIREESLKHGYIFRKKAPYEIISNLYISSIEIVKIKQIETMVDLYYNKGGFLLTVEKLINYNEGNPFLFYEGLSSYYYNKGHQHRSHKKEDLYRILLGYCHFIMLDANQMKEYLLHDMKETLNAEAVKNFERKGFNAL